MKDRKARDKERVYYNENDPRAAAWLRELIKDGLIPKGEVDERSIADVEPGDLAGYTQCHFFAGNAIVPEEGALFVRAATEAMKR